MIPNTTLFYAGLNGLLILVLSIRVVKVRIDNKVSLGDGGNKELLRWIRIHGNATENIPIVLFLILILELQGAPSVLLHGIGVALTTGRLLHVQGLIKTTGVSQGRKIGMLLTWASLLVGSLLSLYYFFI